LFSVSAKTVLLQPDDLRAMPKLDWFWYANETDRNCRLVPLHGPFFDLLILA
jgi:hypothetical protein